MATTTRAKSRNGTSTNGAKRTTGNPNPRYARLGQEVQGFDACAACRSPSPTKARSESCELLNEILADTTILYALYKKAHWNVAGPTFYQLHLLFDKHAEEQLELIDEIAERVQMLGGISVGDPRHAAELTTIERAPDGAEEIPAQITGCSPRTRRSSRRSARASRRPRSRRTWAPTTC